MRNCEVSTALDELLFPHRVNIDGRNLEKALFDHSLGNDRAYQHNLQQIMYALSHDDMEFPRCCSDDTVQAFLHLTAFCDNEIKSKIALATRVPTRQRAEEGYMTCRCGSKRIEWEDRHIRSADEGATLFCVCTDCGARWRISA